MDLILWRHAQAEELSHDGDDLARRLTPQGERQAARMAGWLDRQLPDGTRIWASPAQRTQQTVLALGRKFKTSAELAPSGDSDQLLSLANWPVSKTPVLIVGHQPTLGRVIGDLLSSVGAGISVRKGSVWWLRHRVREGAGQTILLTVQSPEFLV